MIEEGEDKGRWIGEGEVRDERVRGVTDEGEGMVMRGGRVEMLGPTLMPGNGHLSHQRYKIIIYIQHFSVWQSKITDDFCPF